MSECVAVVEVKNRMIRGSRSGQLRVVGAIPYCGIVEVSRGMKSIVMVAACAWTLSSLCCAQDQAAADKPATQTAKGTTLIGCLAGPDSDDHYKLTSMQHRLGVDVVGGDELKEGVGGKVKLTGSWEAIPGVDAKKGDAARRFKVTAVSVMEEKCGTPAPTTPVSKKKQAQLKAQQKQ